MRYDREFYFELSICADYGIPHSEFLAWDPDDQAKAIAFGIEKNMHCIMCGTSPWEWDPGQGGKRNAYEAVETLCMGCYAKAAAQVNDPNRNQDGITVELVATGTRESAQRMVKQKRRAARGDS